MTSYRNSLYFALIGLACMIGFVLAGDESDSIHITTRSSIRAGDELFITIQIDEANAGDTVSMTLVNGLNFINETLILGTGGIAIWHIEADIITQAGGSLIIARYSDREAQVPLKVISLKTGKIDIFPNANNIGAYGDDSTTIMMLPEDRWGNTPHSSEQFDIKVIYPDTSRITDSFEMLGGIGLYTFISKGNPGRVRVEASSSDIIANLELIQIPSQAQSLTLSINPTCVLNDGRDLVTLSIDVQDSFEQAVTDGTLITVRWDDGLGFARTIDGTATLRLPTFDIAGHYTFYAQVGDVVSSDVMLQVVEESCLE